MSQLSRDPNLLHPEVRKLYDKFMEECAKAGIKVTCTCTWRSYDQQFALYAQGRTVPGKKVTNAKAGTSAHNYAFPDGKPASLAFDVVVVIDGKACWETGKDPGKTAWLKIGEIGTKVGLVWGGNFKSFKDYPHFELPGSTAMLKERFPEAWKK